MSEKQSLLKAVSALPDTATAAQVTDALLDYFANRGSLTEFAKLYRAQMSADQLAEYFHMKPELELRQVVAEIEAFHSKRESA
jgi:hypothetical protein